MSKARNILGVITGIVLILSSAAHSFLGWKSMSEQLRGSGAAPDLITGLAIGWNFAGVSIFMFGCLIIGVFAMRLRGQDAPLWVPRLIGLGYTIAGIAAYQVSKQTFFLSVFVVPGVLISMAAWGTDQDAETE